MAPVIEPAFDRGRFAVPVAGRLTQGAITEMHAVSRSIGARFVVMFVPFKSQVYLPLLEDALPKDDLRSALSYYLESFGRPVARPPVRKPSRPEPVDAAILRQGRRRVSGRRIWAAIESTCRHADPRC